MMSVLTLVFSKFFPNGITGFPVYLLCGLVPFKFFSLSWSGGNQFCSSTKRRSHQTRVLIPREVVPIASVLSNCLHLLIQIGVLLVFTIAYRYGVNREWVWLPVIWGLEVIFVLGLVLACSAIDVYLRDMRYLVESSTTILFYLVPIFYSAEKVPAKYVDIYQWNPLAAIVLALRRILMESMTQVNTFLWKLTLGSLVTLVAGWTIFRGLQRRFYDHL